MEIINTQQLIEKIKEIEPNGLELSTRMGVLTTTKGVFYRNGLIFYFYMEFDFLFDIENGITEKEFAVKFKQSSWRVEQVIN